jgi:hypothetical protein
MAESLRAEAQASYSQVQAQLQGFQYQLERAREDAEGLVRQGAGAAAEWRAKVKRNMAVRGMGGEGSSALWGTMGGHTACFCLFGVLLEPWGGCDGRRWVWRPRCVRWGRRGTRPWPTWRAARWRCARGPPRSR